MKYCRFLTASLLWNANEVAWNRHYPSHAIIMPCKTKKGESLVYLDHVLDIDDVDIGDVAPSEERKRLTGSFLACINHY